MRVIIKKDKEYSFTLFPIIVSKHTSYKRLWIIWLFKYRFEIESYIK